ncbi:transposase [Dolichospermum sp. UHCC 0684]|uniref:transposase n=1 Tax=Nostocales TaxID=1161 RepID=UPI0002F8F485|nr:MULTISPECIES: transposase [Nostocales]MBO1051577.1 transposase [Dolichospermum sp. DET73]MEA5528004.1 transposase [Dolichospermum sp. UHCC 0684]
MRKLTDSDKQEILKLYRETAETTSTLAERYGVSNSTISRLLKSTLPEEEYEFLVSLKRAARTPEGRAQVSYEQLPLLTQPPLLVEASSSVSSGGELLNPKVEKPTIEAEALPKPEPENDFDFDQPIPANRRVKTRSSAVEKPKLPVIKETPIVKELEIVRHKPTETPIVPKPKIEVETRYSQPSLFAEILDEDLLDEPDDLEDDDLDDDLYEDEEDFEDEDYEAPKPLVTRRGNGEVSVQVLPLSVANLPKTCYLVIDRSAELITRPLKDFGDLGLIPSLENQQKTLPIFDNHRVAKRFSTKRDRVIKVPDSQMLHKASSHLQAKGITRLLIDGQVYSLSLV